MKIAYNSPVILTYTLIAVAVFAFSCMSGSVITMLGLSSEFSFSSPQDYLNLVSYIFVHSTGKGFDINHLLGNFSIILLVGPILEEKHGSGELAEMIGITALVTAVLHILLFSGEMVIGASGIAFMMIILVSCTSVKKGELPLTFILVILIYLSNEVIGAIKTDQISQFAHILGAGCGAAFGLKKK